VLAELDKKRRIPTKTDDAGWVELRRYISWLEESSARVREAKAKVGSRKIDKKVAAIQSNPHTKRKRAKLRELKDKADASAVFSFV
jgi:hypothetical protein